MNSKMTDGDKQEASLAFTETRIGDLTLKNRLIRAGCFESLSEAGRVTDRLIEHHTALARGGIAMTTVGYCAVSPDGRAFERELIMEPEALPGLTKLTDKVHKAGAAASIQLVHCGFFADPKVIGHKAMGASKKLCTYRMSRCEAMTEADIEEKTEAFAKAAAMAKEAGFDAVEIHAGHGYLLSQFLSPWTNLRKDSYGGSLANRIKFPAAVVRRARERLGTGYPILVKFNQFDGFRGGLDIGEAAEVARAFQEAGASALVPSCGFTSKTPFAMLRGNLPVREMAGYQKKLSARMSLHLFGRLFVQYYPFTPLFLFEGAREILKAVTIPVVYVGGVLSAGHIGTVLKTGFTCVQIGRATIRDPELPNRMREASAYESDCDMCNRCVAANDGPGVYCVSTEKGLMPGWR